MADRWMDERDRDWRDRDWRRSEAYGRSGGEPRRYGEQRSWADAAGEDEARREELRRRRIYDPDEADYGGRSSVAGGGAQPSRGQRDYGYARSYLADRDRDERRGRRDQEGYGEDFWRPRGDPDAYGYRGREAGRARWEDRREEAGDFLQRAGERIGSWFRGEGPAEARRQEDDDRTIDRGHRGRGPKGYQRTDERITEDVSDRLTEDPWLDATDIEVAVKDGEVTLSGHVDNREAKHRAERLVEDLSGVRHVQNNLRVDPNAVFTGAGRGFGSSALEAEMRRNELANDPGNHGASGASGRTSTGAAAEPSTGAAAEPKKRS